MSTQFKALLKELKTLLKFTFSKYNIKRLFSNFTYYHCPKRIRKSLDSWQQVQLISDRAVRQRLQQLEERFEELEKDR